QGYPDIWLVDPATGNGLRRIYRHRGGKVKCIAYAPDGRSLAFATEDDKAFATTVRLWDPVTGRELRRFEHPPVCIAALAFSPDGKALAAASSFSTDTGKLVLWDAETGKAVRTRTLEWAGVGSLLFSRDGKRLITGHKDGSIRFWDSASLQLAHRF